jgi:hypothetical protein
MRRNVLIKLIPGAGWEIYGEKPSPFSQPFNSSFESEIAVYQLL